MEKNTADLYVFRCAEAETLNCELDMFVSVLPKTEGVLRL